MLMPRKWRSSCNAWKRLLGKILPLQYHGGQVHDYLGMTLDFRTKGKVQINMEHYIDMMLQDAPEEMKGIATTPATSYLFKVNDKDPHYLGTRKRKSLYTS